MGGAPRQRRRTVTIRTLNSVYLFAPVEYWIDFSLFWLLLIVRLWAVIDCATRKSAAFPAAGKLTKPAWLAITVGGGVLGAIFPGSPYGLLQLVTLVAALVYLADVRPAVREVSGGSGSRW